MSEKQEVQQVGTEVETEVEQTDGPQEQQLSRRERRRQNQQQQQRQFESAKQAPAELFTKSKPVDLPVDEETLTIIKLQIDTYVEACGRGRGEGKEQEVATRGFQKTIRKILTLQGATLREAFAYLYKEVKENDTGAFTRPIPFRWAHAITGEQSRIAYSTFVNLVLTYAPLNNPSFIHQRVDVAQALSFVKDQQQRSELIRLFAAK